MSVNNFGLFFTRDGTVIRLPVNPEKLPVARDNDNSEYNVLGIGPIMIPRIPKLREVTISSFFPGREFSGSNQWGAFHPPEYYIQFFESAMNDKAPIIYTPVRYYENGEPFMTGDTGFEVLVTQFNTEERGGETGDFYYGDEPHGTASGRRVLVSRIVDATRPASVHITDEAGNPLGWIDKNALQVVSDT